MQDQIYREIILEYWKNPHNYGVLKPADIDVSDLNVICGDEIRITARIKNNKIEEIRFESEGCAVSKAGGSIFTDLIKNKSLEQVKKITAEGFLNEIGIDFTPARKKCALLAYSIFRKSI